jgi:hypothetical protein
VEYCGRDGCVGNSPCCFVGSPGLYSDVSPRRDGERSNMLGKELPGACRLGNCEES